MFRWGEWWFFSAAGWISEVNCSLIFFFFFNESLAYWYDSPETEETRKTSANRSSFVTDLCVEQIPVINRSSREEYVRWSYRYWSKVIRHLYPNKWCEMECIVNREDLRSVCRIRRIWSDDFDLIRIDEILLRTEKSNGEMERNDGRGVTLLFTSNKENIISGQTRTELRECEDEWLSVCLSVRSCIGERTNK